MFEYFKKTKPAGPLTALIVEHEGVEAAQRAEVERQQTEQQRMEQESADALATLTTEAEMLISIAERAAADLKQSQDQLFTLLYNASTGLKKPFHPAVQEKARRARYRLANAFVKVAEAFRLNRSFEIDGEVWLGDMPAFSPNELATRIQSYEKPISAYYR